MLCVLMKTVSTLYPPNFFCFPPPCQEKNDSIFVGTKRITAPYIMYFNDLIHAKNSAWAENSLTNQGAFLFAKIHHCNGCFIYGEFNPKQTRSILSKTCGWPKYLVCLILQLSGQLSTCLPFCYTFLISDLI